MSDNPGPSRPVFAKFSTTGGHSTTVRVSCSSSLFGGVNPNVFVNQGDIEEQISVHVDKEEFHAVV